MLGLLAFIVAGHSFLSCWANLQWFSKSLVNLTLMSALHSFLVKIPKGVFQITVMYSNKNGPTFIYPSFYLQLLCAAPSLFLWFCPVFCVDSALHLQRGLWLVQPPAHMKLVYGNHPRKATKGKAPDSARARFFVSDRLWSRELSPITVLETWIERNPMLLCVCTSSYFCVFDLTNC